MAFTKKRRAMGDEELLLKVGDCAPTAWSARGQLVIYNTRVEKTRRDVWALTLYLERQPYPLLNSDFDEYRAQLAAALEAGDVIAEGESAPAVAILDALSRVRLVGRAEGLAEARELWRRAREGRGHCLLLSGEPARRKNSARPRNHRSGRPRWGRCADRSLLRV